MSEKLIFGTSENINFELLTKIYSKSLIFHTSYDYDGYNNLKEFLISKSKFQIIFKVKYQNLEDLKNLIRKYKNDFKSEKIYAIQISRNPNFFDNLEVIKYLEIQKKNNFISKIYLELYWNYSSTVKNKIKNSIIDGYVFCYNPIEREVSNSVLKEIKINNKEIISLRSFSGFKLTKENKTFYHISYLKFYLIKNYILILKKIIMSNYLSICLIFIKLGSINYSVFSTTKKNNFEEIINTYEKITYSDKNNILLKIINIFHKIFWMFGGTNSSSSIKITTSMYYRVERKVLKFLKITKK